ncbi:hypothetical protein HOG17_01480 [Candidatus Peregrinibacteria bacterium]|jgi:Fe-S-cluster containining protein|nr:hypothetical protein [Candidatus Peregrinibacteria bacterium]MBT4148404.1 hypothetical protein [Candidatus Peregrinibacteria bacterium]MBT4366463.1 hypothetical protein [Candidatus Peregrinibacteria bacterium]MBT4456086.1 hypothetical protein [Candidatus Peregrinibacteria bacterium]
MTEALLEQYKLLLEKLDQACEKTMQDCKDIPCRKGCCDCCKQMFPLSLIEAFYISEGIKSLDRKTRRELQRQAEKVLPILAKLDLKQFEISSSSLEDIAQARNSITTSLQSTNLDCPLLDADICKIYDHRNHDCRIHGVSFDPQTNEIIGCHRHPKIFSTAPKKGQFIGKAVTSGFLYKEKSKLDSLLTESLSQDPNQKYTYYFTHPLKPILEDFQTFNWQEFFASKPKSESKYSLIVHI